MNIKVYWLGCIYRLENWVINNIIHSIFSVQFSALNNTMTTRHNFMEACLLPGAV